MGSEEEQDEERFESWGDADENGFSSSLGSLEWKWDAGVESI